MKKTAVLGATPNSARYAYQAANMLVSRGHPIVPIGIKTGEVAGEEILDLRTRPKVTDIHTVTLYIGPDNQTAWIDYIISLAPKRIIFNPGTENQAFETLAKSKGIDVLQACTLVMLSIGNY